MVLTIQFTTLAPASETGNKIFHPCATDSPENRLSLSVPLNVSFGSVFFVFNLLFDIRERPENAIKTSESGRVCKYATPESEQMKAKGYRTSISPAQKPMDVRPWLCGRTFKGCLHVRREGLRTYVQRVPGRTSKEPLNRAERN